MPYTSEHMLLQWGGFFHQSDQTSVALEQFSGSLRFAGPGIDAADNNQTAASMALALSSFWVTTGSYIPNNAFLEFVKWNRIGTDGKYVNQLTRLVGIKDTPGSAQKAYPLQVSWATTWRSEFTRGLANAGRTYWPTAVPLSSTTRRTDATTAENMAKVSATLINSLNTAALTGLPNLPPSSPPQWAIDFGWAIGATRDATGPVASIMSKVRTGRTTVIKSVGCGTRLDIQRRRATDQPEEYQTVTLASRA